MVPRDSGTAVFRVTAFGTLRFGVDGAASPAVTDLALQFESRRRTLAVLLVLALSPRPLSRDILADYFWPDSDPTRARHSLAESLRVIRSVLGADAVGSRTQLLALDPSVPLTLDVLDFRQAIAARHWEDAVALYTADFLDGIHIDRAPRFEHWVDEQRVALRTQFVQACEQYLAARRRAGLTRDDAAVARRWLAAAPLSGEAALAWCQALAGDRSPEALRDVRGRFAAWRATLLEEFEEEPDERVSAFMASLESAPRPAPAAPPIASTAAPQSPAALPPTEASAPAGEPEVSHKTEVSPTAAVVLETGRDDLRDSTPRAAAARFRRPSRVALVVGTASLVVAAVAAVATRNSYGSLRDLRGTPASPTLIVIADAQNATADTGLGDAVTVAVGTGLSNAQSLRVLPASRVRELRRFFQETSPGSSAKAGDRISDSLALAIAVRAGASAVVVPVVIALGSQYRIASRIIRVRDGLDVASPQSAPVDSSQLLAAVDQVVRETRVRLGASQNELAAAPPLPEVTTASLPALRAYASGLQAFNRGEYAVALSSHQRAVQLDSTFAMAWVALGGQLAYLNRALEAESSFVKVAPLLARLTPREQVMARANIARWRTQLDTAIALRQRWLDAYPDDLYMLEALAYDLLRARRSPEAVDAYRRLVARDSTDDNAWLNLSVVLRRIPGEERAAVDAFGRAVRLSAKLLRDPIQGPQYASLLVSVGLLDSAARVLRAQIDSSPSLSGRAYRALGQLELWRAQPAAAVPLFRNAVAASRSAREDLSVLRTMLWLESALRDAGDSAAAHAVRDSLLPVARQVTEPVVLFWTGQRLARAGDLRAARTVLELLRTHSVSTNRVHRSSEYLLRAELSAADGRGKDAVSFARQAMQLDSTDISDETLAYATWRLGRREEATTLFETLARRTAIFGSEPSQLIQRAPYVVEQIRREGSPGAIALPGRGALRAVGDRGAP